jgi:hypothetical protein
MFTQGACCIRNGMHACYFIYWSATAVDVFVQSSVDLWRGRAHRPQILQSNPRSVQVSTFLYINVYGLKRVIHINKYG